MDFFFQDVGGVRFRGQKVLIKEGGVQLVGKSSLRKLKNSKNVDGENV